MLLRTNEVEPLLTRWGSRVSGLWTRFVRVGGGHDLLGGHQVNECPAGWFRDAKPAAPHDGSGNRAGPVTGSTLGRGGAPAAGDDPTVRLPVRTGADAGVVGGGSSGRGTSGPTRRWPDQPPLRSAPGDPKRGPLRGPGHPWGMEFPPIG
jgi:hypothetical protein